MQYIRKKSFSDLEKKKKISFIFSFYRTVSTDSSRPWNILVYNKKNEWSEGAQFVSKTKKRPSG